MNFVSVDVGYDENSNPLTTEENIYGAGFDVKYAIDGMDRVTDADEGTLSSGSITSRTRRQEWTLTQTGNWDNEKLDLDGDGAWGGTGEHNDTRTHNAVNDQTARDTNSDSTKDYSLTYDAAGNLTDDGETYAYVYDAWYRLRKIKDRGTGAVLSEHQYYGNGFRAGAHYDADLDSDVDSNDPWYWFAYDERWRIVGTFVGSDSSPKERFLHHTAGGNGYGSSSYIDQVVLRERDANTGWHLSSDGTLEERLYYCQNWRHDVVALVASTGTLKERVRYSSYGVPFGIPLGDCDSDGDVDSGDQTILNAALGTSSPKCDLDLSGTIDATDQSILLGNSGATAGVGELSRTHNRRSFAGVISDATEGLTASGRGRSLPAQLGIWMSRDESGYVAGSSLYQYCRSNPSARLDPSTTLSIAAVYSYTPNSAEATSSDTNDPPDPVQTSCHDCCKSLCPSEIGDGIQAFYSCCNGTGFVCACPAYRPTPPGWGIVKRKTLACMHLCEPLHALFVDCAGTSGCLVKHHTNDCRRFCSEAIVYACFSLCFQHSINCDTDVAPENKATCERIKQSADRPGAKFLAECLNCTLPPPPKPSSLNSPAIY